MSESGQKAVDELVALLELEQLEVDIFRGLSPQVSMQRVFGGQVAGQALVAAGRTVRSEPASEARKLPTLPADRGVHSLHAYFLRPGDPKVPIIYTVDRIRDGRSFTSRRVVAIQHGKAIFSLSASFHVPEEGLDHQTRMPAAPDPESLPTLDERMASFASMEERAKLPQPIDLRYVQPPSWEQREIGPRVGPNLVWLRTAGTLPDDPLLHVCALTFASDLTLLESVMVHHGKVFGGDVQAASLDHAMWFHRPFRADAWLLYESESPSASGGRGLAAGRIWTQDGRHIATLMQEGLVRPLHRS